MNSEWIRAFIPRASPQLRYLVAVGMVMLPAGIAIGWMVRASEHDSMVNNMVNEFKERERLGEVVPVAIPPNVRLQLEEEREEIISKLHALQRKREAALFEDTAAELRQRMRQDNLQPESIR
ncbi:unnamed protein product [Symbiodinium sp. KB8]|nr:unnamed protein product [Symbiodinium sp. KB8]